MDFVNCQPKKALWFQRIPLYPRLTGQYVFVFMPRIHFFLKFCKDKWKGQKLIVYNKVNYDFRYHQGKSIVNSTGLSVKKHSITRNINTQVIIQSMDGHL